jgi:RHS repeat-associated protein
VSDGSLVAEYEYDYRDLRIKKVTPTETVRYHWDPQGRLVRESDGNGNTLARYIWNDQDRLVAIENGGAMYYPHFNHRGDILAVTDATGTRVATYQYSPWGELIGQTGNFEQPWRYAGYYFDSETSMYYLKARYYDPSLGRFLTKDTFTGFEDDPQSLNLYAYVKNNPNKFDDPSGHRFHDLISKFSGGGGGPIRFGFYKKNAAQILTILLLIMHTKKIVLIRVKHQQRKAHNMGEILMLIS